jgi:UDP-N-acetyl-2-amino-2-deoxyglucuronate dehydrogenase
VPGRHRIGIIGAGAIATAHALAYRSHPTATLVGVADVDLQRAKRLCHRFGATFATADPGELLSCAAITAVSVCTPPTTHGALVEDAICAGKHVACEKPLVTSLVALDAIMQASVERPSVVVSTLLQHRANPVLERARELLANGELGEITSASMTVHVRRPAEYYGDGGRGGLSSDGGGVLLIHGIHLLDLLLWLLGPVRSVSATMATRVHRVDTEDTVAAWLELLGGVLVAFTATTTAAYDGYDIVVAGTTGTVHLVLRPGLARTWRVTVSRKGRAGAVARRSGGQRRVARARVVGRMAAGRLLGSGWQPDHWGHTEHLRRFLRACEGRGPAPVPPAEARGSLELALALYEAAMSGRVVHLPLDPACERYAGLSAAAPARARDA